MMSVQPVITDTKVLRELLQCPLAAIKFNQHISAGVAALLRLCRPPAVLRGVIGAVVVPLDGRSGWPLAHIVKKVLEALIPAFTHRNSPPPVPMELNVIRIAAALAHSNPRVVLAPVLLSQAGVSALLVHLARKTATTLSAARLKIAFCDDLFNPAITYANPPRPFHIGSASKDEQSPEATTGNINEIVCGFGHDWRASYQWISKEDRRFKALGDVR